MLHIILETVSKNGYHKNKHYISIQETSFMHFLSLNELLTMALTFILMAEDVVALDRIILSLLASATYQCYYSAWGGRHFLSEMEGRFV